MSKSHTSLGIQHCWFYFSAYNSAGFHWLDKYKCIWWPALKMLYVKLSIMICFLFYRCYLRQQLLLNTLQLYAMRAVWRQAKQTTPSQNDILCKVQKMLPTVRLIWWRLSRYVTESFASLSQSLTFKLLTFTNIKILISLTH